MSLQQINGTLVQVSPASAEAEVAEFKRCKRVFAKGPPRSLATVKAEALAWVGQLEPHPHGAGRLVEGEVGRRHAVGQASQDRL